MNRKVLWLLTTLALTGCAQSVAQKTLSAHDLENHRFVLQSVNGTPFVAQETGNLPELSFDDKLQISGAMCNRFFGQATLEGDQLSVKNLAMTRMLCGEMPLNTLDNQLGQMLNTGAKISFDGQQLTLKSHQYSLSYRLANPQ